LLETRAAYTAVTDARVNCNNRCTAVDGSISIGHLRAWDEIKAIGLKVITVGLN